MPKRIVDGEGLWRSDKLAKVTPPKYKAEYANILPLALANGVFECSVSRVWSQVYAFNRPEISRKDVEKILKSFEDVGLLFLWADGGKVWAYFTGSEKRGRLPSQSLRERYGVGPNPPQDQLAEYLRRNGHSQNTAPVTPEKPKAIKTLPDGFGISDGIRQWAADKGYTHLEQHLDHFAGVAKAKGYTYCDWDAALKNAIRQNWAKLENKQPSNGAGLLERTKAALEAE
jgi:hypothetical protein